MERKKKAGNGLALYGTIAVCLLAAGVGSWQILRRDTVRTPGVSGPAAVSGAITAPDDRVTSSLPDTSPIPDAAPDTEPDSRETSAPAVVPAEPSPAPAESVKTPAAAAPATLSAKREPSPTPTVSPAPASPTPSPAPTVQTDARLVAQPLYGQTVTAFSMDELLYNETLRDWRTHDGIDIAADAGTQVLAARAGTVESVTEDPLMGIRVAIRHDGELETVYACLSEPGVEAGEEVSAGQVIGFVGESATAEAALGPHLHFSILDAGTAVNPEEFLPEESS